MKNFKFSKIPEATIKRLSIYNRILNELLRDGVEVVSSSRLSEISGLNAAQIRKDLTYFGEFGVRGVGYFVKHLSENIKSIIGLNKSWNVILIGVGKVGQALLSYENLRKQGYHIVAAFDTDPDKAGIRFGTFKIPIHHLDKLPSFVEKNNVRIGIIATPAEFAESSLKLLESCGIQGVVNFAPVKLTPEKKGTKVTYIDIVTEFDKIAFKLSTG